MNLPTEAPILVVGAGSIGERHIAVLQTLGFKNLFIYRQRNLPLRTIDQQSITIFTDWLLVNKIRPLAAIICSPTSQHLEQTIFCVEHGIHTLVEKPLSDHYSQFKRLNKALTDKPVVIQVAYMLRYHPCMQQLKKWIVSDHYGKLLSFDTHWGEYLPDWHPWEDYKTSYAARKDLGGGAALTLSHDIDIIYWLLDSIPDKSYALSNHKANLDVTVESGADFLFKFPSGTTGHVHLNFFQKAPFRFYQYVFENAAITYDYFANKLIIRTKEGEEVMLYEQFERNQLFTDQTKDFFYKIGTLNSKEALLFSTNQIEVSESIIKTCLLVNE